MIAARIITFVVDFKLFYMTHKRCAVGQKNAERNINIISNNVWMAGTTNLFY